MDELKKMQDTLDIVERMYYLLSELKVHEGLHSVQVAIAPSNYFDLSLA